MILLDVSTTTLSLRISSAPYAHPTAPGIYEERLLDTSWLERRLGASLGWGRGRMVLGNLDGHLDWLASAEIEGQAVRLSVGEDVHGGFVPVFTGRVEQALIGRDEVTLVLCDSLDAVEADPMLEPVGGQRWRASLTLTPAVAAVLDLGTVVAVGETRLLVTGLRLEPVSQRLEVTLWG